MSEDEKYGLPKPDLGVFGNEPPGDTTGEDAGQHGTMNFQDRSTTTPRQPTLAEQRARIEAENELAEQRSVVEARALRRRRVMIGAGVTVGVVAVVGAWYLLASPKSVTAECTAADGPQSDTVVADQNCDPDYANSHGGYYSNGFVFLPIPGGGYRQYRYYYGGSPVGIGQHISGGSFTAPANANVHTNSGKTIQRGGFGISGKVSGGGGGSKGGS